MRSVYVRAPDLHETATVRRFIRCIKLSALLAVWIYAPIIWEQVSTQVQFKLVYFPGWPF